MVFSSSMSTFAAMNCHRVRDLLAVIRDWLITTSELHPKSPNRQLGWLVAQLQTKEKLGTLASRRGTGTLGLSRSSCVSQQWIASGSSPPVGTSGPDLFFWGGCDTSDTIYVQKGQGRLKGVARTITVWTTPLCWTCIFMAVFIQGQPWPVSPPGTDLRGVHLTA